MPEVTARKSRYSYGLLVDKPIKNLKNFDIIADEVKFDPEGNEVTQRMDWYLRKVREDRKMGK